MCPVRVHDVFLPNNTGTDLGILVTNHICSVRIQDALLPLDNESVIVTLVKPITGVQLGKRFCLTRQYLSRPWCNRLYLSSKSTGFGRR